MSKPVKILIQYLAAIGACLALGGAYLSGTDFLTADLQNRYRLLSDALFLPGALCTFSGLCMWLSNEGAFDAVSWLVTYAFKSLLPGSRTTRESYGDYRARRQEKKVSGFGFLLVVGIAMIAASMVFVYLFNSMY